MHVFAQKIKAFDLFVFWHQGKHNFLFPLEQKKLGTALVYLLSIKKGVEKEFLSRAKLEQSKYVICERIKWWKRFLLIVVQILLY